MLKEIYCDKFVSYGSVRDPIRFNFGLNCVLGTDDAANSIGKSTFLMIVDFVFGGNDYLKQREIIDIIGEHEICFCFDFEGKEFHFKVDVKVRSVLRYYLRILILMVLLILVQLEACKMILKY